MHCIVMRRADGLKCKPTGVIRSGAEARAQPFAHSTNTLAVHRKIDPDGAVGRRISWQMLDGLRHGSTRELLLSQRSRLPRSEDIAP